MNPEITKIIDQYLQGELSAEDQLAFEKRLAESDVLQKELDLQKSVYEGAKRASVRTQVQQTSQSYHFSKKMQMAGIIVAAIVAVTALTFWATSAFNKKEGGSEITAEIQTLINRLEKESPIENLKSEFFTWNGLDSVVLSQKGVLLSIPENAFLLNGKPYSDQAVIQWQEALDGATIVKSGLSTMSGDRLLETQGMFSIQAFTPDGRKLDVNPKTGIYVQVPVDEYKSEMQLFEGKKNSEGIVDWQNPKPLLKIPVPVDMSLLDFYPNGYEKELDKLKLRKDKKYRDSLYLSFSGHAVGIAVSASDSFISVTEEKNNRVESGNLASSSGKDLFKAKCATCHQFHKDGTGPKLFGVREKWAMGGANAGSIYQWVKDWEKAAYKDPYAAAVARMKPTAMWTFPELSAEQIASIFDYVDSQGNEYEISPEKVMAFWNPKFNNTNLTTREFEKRMQAIFQTCSNAVLDKYVQNLSKPISQIDAEVAAMGHAGFDDFAAEQLGAVNPGNPHLKNLMNFYGKAIRQMQKEVHNNRAELLKKQQQWDEEITGERTKEQSRTANRESKALEEEYNFNMKNVHKQLGRTIGFQVYGTSTIYNIDKYVMDATIARITTIISDPETGKKATITYNDFSFEVENADQYDQVYAYLFPTMLNSYQRISGTDGKFSYPLNDGMMYDLAIVGVSEKGYSYFQKKMINKGKLGKVTLKNIGETKLNASIEQLNSGRLYQPMSIKDELNWLMKEQKNYKEQKLRQEQAVFRRKMESIIFPCAKPAEYEYNGWIVGE